LRVQAFKVGPDFIDPAHHALVTGRPSYNLDAWMCGRTAVLECVARHAEDADVVLVEPKDAFVHNIAALRALVDPAWLPSIYLPYDRLLARGRVVRDRAYAVDAGRVVLASGAELTADFVVLATGSRYPFPAKNDVPDSDDAHERYRAAHKGLSGARRVLLLGAGPVGLELAGEIKAAWPDKDVIITDLADHILVGPYDPRLRAELRRQLDALGVELHLGGPLREAPPTASGTLRPFTVTAADGRRIAADLWYACYGVHPVSDYLTGRLARARTPEGYVRVTPDMRVEGHGTVFAIGDLAAGHDNKAAAARRQAEVVAANIRALAGGGALVAYEPGPPVLVVPLGPAGGAAQLPGRDEIAGPEFVAQVKGRDLMVDRYAEIMGVRTTPETR
jgi:NADH dehydrogenase FAD-containing subunit